MERFKKLLGCLLILGFVFACHSTAKNNTYAISNSINNRVEVREIKNKPHLLIKDGISILEIEGCEYIVIKHFSSAGQTVAITHKANCTLCSERHSNN